MPAYSSYGTASPYYSNAITYGSPWGLGFPTTPVGRDMSAADFGRAWTRETSAYAGGQDPYSRYVQSQAGRIRDAFEAAQLTNPLIRPDDYLRSLGGYESFLRRFKDLAPSERGERWGTNAPRTRITSWQGAY